MSDPGATRQRQERFFSRSFDATLPMLVWAAHFFAAYAWTAGGCKTDWAYAMWGDWSAMRIVLLLGTVCALALNAGLLMRAMRRYRSHSERLMSGMRLGCGVLGIIGIAWTAVPMLVLPVCLR